MEAVLIIIYLAIAILMIVSMWTIFAKAGKPGWAVLIPIYNIIVFLEIIEKPWWWLFLWMIPLVNYVFIIWSWNLLVKKFGKSEGFTVGIILLAPVFIPILAFGGSTYEGAAPPEGKETPALADTLLLVIIIAMLVQTLTITIMNRWVPGWYSGTGRYIWSFLNIILAFIPLVLGYIINNKTMKILGIIIGAILAVLSISQNVIMLARGF